MKCWIPCGLPGCWTEYANRKSNLRLFVGTVAVRADRCVCACCAGGLISAVCGSVIYKLIVTFVVDIELFGTNSANLMKLMCAVIVAATFIIPAAKRTARNRKVKKEARHNA